jgi:hypothetical protein
MATPQAGQQQQVHRIGSKQQQAAAAAVSPADWRLGYWGGRDITQRLNVVHSMLSVKSLLVSAGVYCITLRRHPIVAQPGHEQ